MQIAKVLKLMALGAASMLPVGAVLLVSPPRSLHAQSLDPFAALTATVTGIGNTITSMGSIEGAFKALTQGSVFPTANFGSLQLNGNTIVSSYRGWMNTVSEESINSAQTPTAQAMESQLLAGYSGGTGTQIGSSYASTYGPSPTLQQVTTADQGALDMQDAVAQDGMKLAILADTNSGNVITTGQSLESSAMASSPGSAPQIEATALSYELQTLAVEHKLLASQLRSQALRLASEGQRLKQGGINAQTGTTAVQSIGITP